MSSHMIRGRQLSRDTEHRKALRRNLVQSLFEHGKIRTTLPKAKEVQGVRREADHAGPDEHAEQPPPRHRAACRTAGWSTRSRSSSRATSTVVQKLFDEVAPKFADRTGGYTRIIKTERLPHRRRRRPGAAPALTRGVSPDRHRPPQRRACAASATSAATSSPAASSRSGGKKAEAAGRDGDRRSAGRGRAVGVIFRRGRRNQTGTGSTCRTRSPFPFMPAMRHALYPRPCERRVP